MRALPPVLASSLAAALLLAGPAVAAAAAGAFPARVERDLAWKGEADLPEGASVAAGATLTLEKGARLRFGAGKALLVEGTLVARGGTDRGVSLSPLGEQPWAGIRLAAGSRGTLDGVRVSGATQGLGGEGAEAALSRSLLERCERGASFGKGAHFSLRETRFVHNQVGVHAESTARGEVVSCLLRENQYGVGALSGAVVGVVGNRFEEGEMGVSLTQGAVGLVRRNLFARQKVGVRLTQGGEGTVIEENLFRASADGAIEALSFSSPKVRDNLFEKGGVGVRAFHYSSPEISRNRFTDLDRAVVLERRCSPAVTGNQFAGNRQGVLCNFSSYPLLRGNLFEGNQLHLAVGEMQSGAWEAAVGSEETMRKNAGEALKIRQDREALEGGFPVRVDATGNWWDEPTRKEMEAKGAEGNIRSLRDGRDPEVTFEGAQYPRDAVTFSPWLTQRPAAGLLAWGGREEELTADDRGVVAGRVVREGRASAEGERPVPGARVAAYRSASLAGEPLAISAPSGADGLYSLRLPAGRYALAASAGELFSAAGQNPVTVAAREKVRLGFVLLPWKPVSRKPGSGEEGAVRGTVTLGGKGAEGVTVSLYLDDADFFRGPAFLSAPTGKDGSFALEAVPPSSYFLVARRRGSGQAVGPMQKGDLYGFLRGNPLRVEAGETVTLSLPVVDKRLDRDVNALGLPGGQPGFGGTVRGPGGEPLAGLHVFAYLEPEMGHHKPAAVSSLTDGKGRYTLYLPGPGRYFVGAREGFGDSPAPGEWFGFWQGNPEHALDLEGAGFLPGVDIAVEKVLQ